MLSMPFKTKDQNLKFVHLIYDHKYFKNVCFQVTCYCSCGIDTAIISIYTDQVEPFEEIEKAKSNLSEKLVIDLMYHDKFYKYINPAIRDAFELEEID